MQQPLLKTFSVFKNLPLIHACSTRIGGKSSGLFSSLNLGLHTADDPEIVKQNRKIFFDSLKINPPNLVFPQQVHSANIAVVNKAGSVPQTDALITAKKGLILTIQTADCYPLFIYEPERHVCAIIHSGWRGTAAQIAAKTISTMIESFNCDPLKMLCAIGAGIQQHNYQVDEKTAQYFNREFLKADGASHYRLDIQAAIIKQLKNSGISEERIEADVTCTYDAADLCYSYRRDGKNSGRMMGVIGLK